ncbi:hypothetical protein NDU88_000754 [Pleurodeles waltl]|uniref:Uncharacterized protein n=1 Tax=Pleurodeles waltl TaxID=8319 RepID=A0AAV7UUA2_PLEWA|nr:hypothetical protein NDU88_000754 [Pleurodeles waltl]
MGPQFATHLMNIHEGLAICKSQIAFLLHLAPDVAKVCDSQTGRIAICDSAKSEMGCKKPISDSQKAMGPVCESHPLRPHFATRK